MMLWAADDDFAVAGGKRLVRQQWADSLCNISHVLDTSHTPGVTNRSHVGSRSPT